MVRVWQEWTSTVKTETNKQIDTMNANNSQRNQTGTLGCNPSQWEGGKLQLILRSTFQGVTPKRFQSDVVGNRSFDHADISHKPYPWDPQISPWPGRDDLSCFLSTMAGRFRTVKRRRQWTTGTPFIVGVGRGRLPREVAGWPPPGPLIRVALASAFGFLGAAGLGGLKVILGWCPVGMFWDQWVSYNRLI